MRITSKCQGTTSVVPFYKASKFLLMKEFFRSLFSPCGMHFGLESQTSPFFLSL
jgi:hypothetical protein